MSEPIARSSSGIVTARGKETAAFGAADMLGLAAMPTFAVMAAATGIFESGSANMLCMGSAGSMLAGMTPMYALMSLFHLPPWLRLVSGGQRMGDPAA